MAVIYQTYEIGEANFIAYVTHNKAEADLWVYLAPSRGLATKSGAWYITKHKTRAFKKVYFGSRGMSQVIIYFTNDIGRAGWRCEHVLKTIIER